VRKRTAQIAITPFLQGLRVVLAISIVALQNRNS
jgi:hypothetical protein